MGIPFSGQLVIGSDGSVETDLVVKPTRDEVSQLLVALRPLVPMLGLVESAEVMSADLKVRLNLPLHPTVRVKVAEDGAG